MKKLTADEIINLLPQLFSSPGELEYLNPIDSNSTEYKSLGTMKIIDSYGGEGCGSDYWFIVLFEDHDVFLKVTGFYQSYNGVEFDNYGKEVKPSQEVVTVYK